MTAQTGLADLARAGMPDGVIDLARALLGPRLLPRCGNEIDAGSTVEAELTRLLLAPLTLDPDWPAPPRPEPVNGGWLHVEVIDEDRPLFDALVARYGDDGPEAVAAACQEARLPVCPYRPAQTSTGAAPNRPHTWSTGSAADGGNVAGTVVVDLTTHWAGPLATKLLAAAGAAVIKVDPVRRPDGFGDRPAVYRHLNGAKDIVDLDLGSPGGRSRFETVVGQADLLIESFSRRVMPNLGYDRPDLDRLRPGLSTVSIKAFPAGSPEADWVAYGPGVHAAAGLAATSTSTTPPDRAESRLPPVPTSIAYPDFLTGIAAYVAAVDILTAQTSARGQAVEVAMASVVKPLRPATVAGPGPANRGSRF